METELDFATMLAHGDFDPDDAFMVPPLHQGVQYVAESDEAFHRWSTEPRPDGFYRRYGNPTQAKLEKVGAAIEHGEAALATASGMGAVSTCLMALLGPGDHVVSQHSMYGGTLKFLDDVCPRLGVEVTFVDQTDNAAFERAMRPNTRLIMLESPTNPLLKITDLSSVAALAKSADALTFIDNTVATPYNQNPISHGIDIVMHSVTKAMSGHADVQAGLLVGRQDLIERMWECHLMIGAVISPFDAWLSLRGLRTLSLRTERHNSSALAVATYLQSRPEVAAVHYPGLPSHPQHSLAKRQMRGYGGTLSFVLKGGQRAAEALIEQFRLAARAASLGGFRTTVVRPASMWSGMLDDEQLEVAGVPGGLLRYAVGLEASDDLIGELAAGLDSLA